MLVSRPLAVLGAAALTFLALGSGPADAAAPAGDAGNGRTEAGPPASPEDRADLTRRLSGDRPGPRVSHVRLVASTRGKSTAQSVRRTADALGLSVDTSELERFGFVTVEATASNADAVKARLESLDGVVSVSESVRYEPMWIPNDPKYASQQSPMMKALQAPTAWDTSRGAGVTIAVLDSGFQASHPDLAGKVVGTWDVVARNTDVTEAAGALAPGHGTAVASVAAAASNNLKGIAGAAPSAKLLLVGVGDSLGDIYEDTSAAGIVWAADHGADVINMSYGAQTDDITFAEVRAIEHALRKGVMIVASAGNDPSSSTVFPAAADGIVAVGATTTTGTAQTSWSAYGSWVDLGAPGVGVPVALPLANDLYDGIKDGYTKLDGTSFSAPLVAGQLALLRSARPSFTGTQLVEAVTGTTKAITFQAHGGFTHGLAQFSSALASLPDTPVIDSATVTGPGVVEIVTTSAADGLKVTVDGSEQNPLSSSVVGDQVTTELSTWGLSGDVTVRAQLCDVWACADADTAVVTVSNPAPELAEPVTGTTVGMSIPLQLSVAPPVDPQAFVRFLADGTTELATVESYTEGLSADTAVMSNGAHQITAVYCSRLATTCDLAHPSDPVTVTVERLRPTVTVRGSGYLSPGVADNRQDTVTVDYSVGTADAAVIGVKNGDTWIRGPISVIDNPVGTWTWDGRNNAAAVVGDTSIYTHDDYQIVIESSAQVATPAPHEVTGFVSAPVIVDSLAPTVGKVLSTPRVFYPYADRYLDTAGLATSITEPAASWWIYIKNSKGATVRTLTGGTATSRVTTSWNGRTTSGAAAPAGTYSITVMVQDRGGNRTTTPGGLTTVSWKKLVYKVATRKLSADLAAQTFYYDRKCTVVYLNARPGSWPSSSLQFVSRKSTATCPKGPPYYAITENRFTLPTAVKYGTFKISTYGGSSVDGTGHTDDVGELDYLMRYGYTIGRVVMLSAATGAHAGPTARVAEYAVDGNKLTWLAGTSYGNWYDIRDYTVTWTYYTLA